MKQHFVVLQWTQKRCFHSDNAQIYCVTQNTLKYFDTPKITVVSCPLGFPFIVLVEVCCIQRGSAGKRTERCCRTSLVWGLALTRAPIGILWPGMASCSIHLNTSQWPPPTPPHAITLPLGSIHGEKGWGWGRGWSFTQAELSWIRTLLPISWAVVPDHK